MHDSLVAAVQIEADLATFRPFSAAALQSLHGQDFAQNLQFVEFVALCADRRFASRNEGSAGQTWEALAYPKYSATDGSGTGDVCSSMFRGHSEH
jgi:hypothetical protein